MAPQRTQDSATRTSSAGELQEVRHGTGRDVVRTVCGREFTVGGLRLEHLAHPAARVSLSTHRLPQDTETLWASFTADEARRLAAHLLAHAAAADSVTVAPPRATEVDYIDARRYAVRVAGSHLLLDPLGDLAEDDAATDLMAAALAVEVARRAERFLARHEIRRDGLRVSAHRGGQPPSRTVTVTVDTPPSLTDERKNALRALLTRSILRDSPCHRLAVEISVT